MSYHSPGGEIAAGLPEGCRKGPSKGRQGPVPVPSRPNASPNRPPTAYGR